MSPTSMFHLLSRALLLSMLVAPFASAAPLRVVVSINPLHSLVTGVMQGVAQPQLLLSAGSSPHSAALRPSEARALERSTLVVWAGPALEGFLARSLANQRAGRAVLTLLDDPQLQRWPAREGGLWADPGRDDSAADGHAPADEHEHEHDHEAHEADPHVWLSPVAARIIVARVAAALAELDPDNAARFASNAQRTLERIDTLDRELNALLDPIAGQPYLLLHDAFQPFEQHYELAAAGALRVAPDRPLGARRLREIRAFARRAGARCLFSEPQLPSTMVARLARAGDMRTGVLDPLGIDIAPGPDAWFALMRFNARALRSCLGNG